jgi:chromosome segregation ATPase
MPLVKTALRLVVIGGLATGTAVLVAGPSRVAHLAGQARQSVIKVIDDNIDDPIILRSQLRRLADQYPEQISELRGSIAEIDTQISQISHEKAIAEKVVEMATADQAELASRLNQAELARVESPYATISVRFDARAYPLEKAYKRATDVNTTVASYSSRVIHAAQTIDALGVQREVFGEALVTLEAELSEYHAQLAILDSEIEMLSRNERALDMLEDHSRTINQLDRFDASSLDHVKARIAKARSEQEMRFESLKTRESQSDYETKAKAMLGAESVARDIFQNTMHFAPVQPETIEIGPAERSNNGQVAMRDSIVIE